MHAAGVLDDGVLASLTAERVERVLAPKVDACVESARAHRAHGFGHVRVVLLGCGSAGSPGQGNYAAANAFLDALAAYRRARGLAACLDGLGVVGTVERDDRWLSEHDVARMNALGCPRSPRGGHGAVRSRRAARATRSLVPLRLDGAALRAQARRVCYPPCCAGWCAAAAPGGMQVGSLARRLAGLPWASARVRCWSSCVPRSRRVLGHASAAAITTARVQGPRVRFADWRSSCATVSSRPPGCVYPRLSYSTTRPRSAGAAFCWVSSRASGRTRPRWRSPR